VDGLLFVTNNFNLAVCTIADLKASPNSVL